MFLRYHNNSLNRIDPNAEQLEEEQIAEQVSRRSPFKFSMLRIPVGTELQFLYDESCTCRTLDTGNKVEFENEEYSLSALASKLLIERHGWKEGTSVAGPRFFTFQYNTLSDLRNYHESTDSQDE